MRLCQDLVNRVQVATGSERVAVLWVSPKSHYLYLWPRVDCWTESRDALTYEGPWPVIAHPLCGSWGKLKAFSRQSRIHGIAAMYFVHKYGGCVEQPSGSELFRLLGRGGNVESLDQGDWGFPSPKPTLIYWYLQVSRPDAPVV
jgi:hypothetical protein